MKGLTAQDRQSWEKEYADKIKGFTPEQTDRLYKNIQFKERFGSREDYDSLKQLSPYQRDSMLMQESIDFQLPDTRDSIQILNDQIQQTIQNAEPVKQRTDELYQKYSEYPGEARKELDNFDKIAETVSPYYKRFKNTEYLPLDDQQKLQIMADYNAAKAAYGEEEANTRLRVRMQDTASENQGVLEKFWNGFKGMGAQTAGALIGTAGMIKGAIDYVVDESNPQLNPLQDFLDHVIDNSWSRYGNDIMKYGSLFDASIQYAKQSGGISNIPIIRTTEEEQGNILDNILSVNTIPELINQQGFTIASMLTGAGLSSISSKAFQGLKGAALAANRAGALGNLEKVNAVLQSLQKAQQSTNAFVIPALVGTVEGVSEGLNTKIQFLDDAKEQISQTQSKAIEAEINRRLQNPEQLIQEGYNPSNQGDMSRLYNDIFKSYSSQYEESVNKAEVDAAKAGVYNMGLNSLINGALNMTLKAGLQTPSVQEAMRRSRIGRIFNTADYEVTSSGKVTPSYGKIKRISNILQEPAGEFSEEYLQSISDAFARGGAEYDLQQFIKNKYEDGGKGAINESIADNLLAAVKAAGESAVDKETILSGIYGALASGLGTPTINNRRGPAIRMQDESKLDYSIRRSPIIYRNPLYEAIKEQREAFEDKSSTAEVVSGWLQDPSNRSKYDGIVGTLNWSNEMENSSSNNDEFTYRNSELGKTINDVMMLQNIQGTNYYNSFMNDLVKSANAEEGSTEAQDLIEQFKSAIPNRGINSDDNQILQTIKKNSNKLLDTMSKITEESNRLDKIFGNSITQDTKQALIFGKLQIEDWTERLNLLQQELKLDIPSTVTSNFDRSSLPELIKYGDIHKAKAKIDEYTKQINDLRNDIENIESRKNITGEVEKSIIKSKKVSIRTLQKEVDKLNKLHAPQSGEQFILNEQDILSLDPIDRATMLDPQNIGKYSKEQQDIISNVIKQGNIKDPNFLSKVQDAGRISLASQSYLSQYNDILSSPENFNAYSNKIKQQVQKDNTKKKYEYLQTVEDYSQFVKELNKSYKGSSIQDRHIIRDLLKNTPNYQRYLENNRNIQGMFDQLDTNENFTQLSDNDKNVLTVTMQYLTDNGTDINDANAEQILQAVDNSGNSELHTYINNINSKLPTEKQINIPSISDITDLFNKVLGEHQKNITDNKVINMPIIPKQTTTEQSKPAAPINVFKQIEQDPNIIGKAGEVVDIEDNKDIKPAVSNIFQQLEKTPSILGEPEAVTKYRINSNDEVASEVSNILKYIANSPQIYSDVIPQAVDVIDNLGDEEYQDIDTLKEAIVTKANSIQVQSQEGGDTYDKLSSLLKQAASKLKQSQNTETLQPQIENNETEKLRNNGLISTARVQMYPNSVVGQAYTNYGIEEYLTKGSITHKTPIMFIADPAIVNSVKQEMGDKYDQQDHLPIMAVVEDKNGPIKLNNTSYQPIGFMPRTSASTQGAARMEQLRKLAIDQQGSLVKDKEGNLITSNGYIRANPPQHTKAGSPNTHIQTIMMNDMSLQDKALINNTSISEEIKKGIYRKYRDQIISRIRKITTDNKGERIHLSYVTSNLKGGETEFELYVSTPQNTNSRQGVPISQVLNQGTPEEIINANSRLYRYSKTLEDFFKKSPFSQDIKFKRDGESLIPIGDGVEKLNSLGDNITKKLSNFISLPKGYIYTFTPTDQMLQNNRLYQMSITDGVYDIPLGLVTNGSITNDTKVQIIKNLMLDGSNFRMSGNYPFAKWQINYNDFAGKEDESDESKKIRTGNIKQIFDDNILESSRESFKYVIRSVDINSPIKPDGTRAFVTPVVSNKVNATQGKPINTPVIVATGQVKSNNAIVDSESGAVLEGTIETGSNVIQAAKKVVNQIEADSKSIKLLEDGSGYIDGDGIKYARVTSIIQADEEAGERFDSNSPWVLPSTNIGTSVDEFVRDYFAGKLKVDETLESTDSEDKLYSYPNASHSSWVAFKQQLDGLKNLLDSKGFTVIPRDITVTGTINVTDNQGHIHSINVAGTLDLLAYDSQGNFHIFDMKTNRSGIDEHKKEKYARQVSLYKKFLEDKYNIKVNSLNIIPIKVDYDIPKGVGRGTAEYSLGAGNQILINGKEYKGANPTLQEVGEVPYTKINIQYNKLSNSEKQMIESTLPEDAKPKTIVMPEVESKVDVKSGLKMGKVKNRFSKVSSKSNVVIPSSNNWDLLSQETRDRAIKMGYTKETWNNMTEQEKKHQKECIE